MVPSDDLLPGDVLDAVAAPVVVLDPEGRILRFNQALEELLGYSTADVRGRAIWDVVLRADDAGIVRAAVARLVAGEAVATGSSPWVTRDGALWRARWTPRVIRDRDGAVTHVVATGRELDVADSDLESLRRREARYRTIVEASDDLIWAVDADMRVTFVNGRGAWRIYGRPVDAIVGRTLDDLLDEYAPVSRALVERVLAGERVHGFELTHPRAGAEGTGAETTGPGERRHLLVSALPVEDEDGNVIAATGIAVDITARKEAEAAQERHAEELEQRVADRTKALREANEDLESFLFSVSHDLRAPLRAIHLFGELLLEDHEDGLDDVGRDYVERIVRASGRMDRLILDLLAYCRVARAELALADLRLEDVVEDALALLRPELGACDADVVVDRPLPRPRANRAVLVQVLVNLLSNAMKFVPQDRRPQIRVAAERTGDLVRLRVSDNGPGIDPAWQGRVFRLFERTHGDTLPGTGLGLAIARRAVERMGGTVGLESTPGDGTTVWVELPAAAAAATTTADRRAPPPLTPVGDPSSQATGAPSSQATGAPAARPESDPPSPG